MTICSCILFTKLEYKLQNWLENMVKNIVKWEQLENIIDIKNPCK